jgi:2-isopropylmalate synthase
VGRTYEAVIRVNSQSGKGGVAYIMKAEHGLDLPRRLQVELSSAVQTITEDTGTEIAPAEMWAVFKREYLPDEPPIALRTYETTTTQDGASVTAQLTVNGEPRTVTAEGNGPIAAFVHALNSGLGVEVEVLDYAEHAVSAGSEATAAAYVETRDADGNVRWGVGLDESILTASLKAVLCGVNRLGLKPA